MSVDTCVTGCAGEVFVFAVGDVEMSFWVTVFFGETKVDYVDLVAAFADAHEEVVGFDVAVDKGFGVDVFDAGDLTTIRNRVEGGKRGKVGGTSWSARRRTVLRENLREQKLKRSSREGPSKSMTIAF